MSQSFSSPSGVYSRGIDPIEGKLAVVAVLVGLSVLVAVDTTEELVTVADCASATHVSDHVLGNAIENNSTCMSILAADTNNHGHCIYSSLAYIRM